MIPDKFIDEIHELHAREQLLNEAWRGIETASDMQNVCNMTEKLDEERATLEAEIFQWVERQPDFKDPDPECPEKTPGYFHVAADVLRRHIFLDSFLIDLAWYWEHMTESDVVGY